MPETCVHHWLITTIPGRTSPGTCKLCGEQKSFPNWLDTATWHERYDPKGIGITLNPEVLRIEAQQEEQEREEREDDGGQ